MLAPFGAFGGLLVSIYYDRLYWPKQKNNKQRSWDLGVFSDCLFGVAGASVVFLVIPGEFNLETNWDIIKVVATAIIGGFAGRALVERVAEDTLKKVKDLEEGQAKMQAETETDATALALLEQHFDSQKDAANEKQLRANIENASARIRVYAFIDARSFRNKMFDIGEWEKMERTKPVFEALIAADKDKEYHRNHSQLAYLCKDKGIADWQGAIEKFTEAIAVRDSKGQKDRFRMYEFCRAICRIQLDSDTEEANDEVKQQILDDLIKVSSETNMKSYVAEQLALTEPVAEGDGNDKLFKQIQTVQSWLTRNDAWEKIDQAETGTNLANTNTTAEATAPSETEDESH